MWSRRVPPALRKRFSGFLTVGERGLGVAGKGFSHLSLFTGVCGEGETGVRARCGLSGMRLT